MGGKIIHKKNFLCQEYFRKLQSVIMSQKINWFLREIDVLPKTNNLNGYFTHNFYNRWEAGGESFQLILPLLNEIKCANPIHMRANLTLRDKDTISSGFHVDNNLKYAKTAVLFINTNNGKLVIQNGDKEHAFESIENDIVIFNSFLKHKTIYHTDTARRYIINMNYFEEENADI